MMVIEMLVKGKTDSELLEAIVAALSDNSEDLIGKLRELKMYDNQKVANVEVVAAIVRSVRNRIAANPNGNQHTTE